MGYAEQNPTGWKLSSQKWAGTTRARAAVARNIKNAAA